MSKEIKISDRMVKTIQFVAQQANISEDSAITRIFAIAESVYMHTDDKDIYVEDTDNKVKISNIR